MAVPLWVRIPLHCRYYTTTTTTTNLVANCRIALQQAHTHTHTHIPKHTQVIYFLVSISSAIYFRKLPQLDSTQLNSTLLFSLSLSLLLLPSSLLYLITSLSRSSFCFPFLFLLSCFLAFFCLSLSVPPLLCVWGHFSSLFPSFFLEKVLLFFLLILPSQAETQRNCETPTNLWYCW